MFENLTAAPADPILGLTEAFQRDADPEKINLSVGLYQDESGRTPVLQCVKAAERRLLESEDTKRYLGIAGLPEYGEMAGRLLLGAAPAQPFVAVQTPGGTGALRVVADLLAARFPGAKIWCSQPTWANHPNVFSRAGLQVEYYPYLNPERTGLNAAALLEALEKMPAGDIVCLHACCHNPTGVDPSLEHWRQAAEVIRRRGLLPLVDCAYQGFGAGLEEDVTGLQILANTPGDLVVCNSFSKNFSLYGERVGAAVLSTPTQSAADAGLSHLKASVRANYSNPPKHGAVIVTEVLGDPNLAAQWRDELSVMRRRINGMRRLLVERLQAAGAPGDFSFITQQQGMFSFSGLTPLQVDQLRSDHSIYIVGSGRINVAGVTPDNVDRLCEAIAQVLKGD